MIVLGIDTGLLNTGWGVIEHNGSSLRYIANGTIKTSSKDELSFRLKKIYEELDQVIKKYEPEFVSVEDTFVNQNPKTSLKLGQARGVALLVPAMNGLPVMEYTPNLVKKSVVGVGHADKNQILTMIKILLPTADKIDSEHSADALAIAIAHTTNYRRF